MTKRQITPGSVDFEHRRYRYLDAGFDLKTSLLSERGGLGGKRCPDPGMTIAIAQAGNTQFVGWDEIGEDLIAPASGRGVIADVDAPERQYEAAGSQPNVRA